MDKAEADATLARLQRAERAHHRNQDALRHAITRNENQIATLTALISQIDTAIERRQDTRGDKFLMTVGDQRHDRRSNAGWHLKRLLTGAASDLDGLRHRSLQPGQLGGFPLTAKVERALGTTSITVCLEGAPGTTIRLSAGELQDADPVGLVTRFETRLTHLEERKAEAQAGTEHAHREIAHAHANLGQPFPQATQLAYARDRAHQIDHELQQMAAPSQSPEATNREATSNQPAGNPDVRNRYHADKDRGSMCSCAPDHEAGR